MNALIQEELEREPEPVELDEALVGRMEQPPALEDGVWPGSPSYRRVGFAILASSIVLVVNIALVLLHGTP